MLANAGPSQVAALMSLHIPTLLAAMMAGYLMLTLELGMSHKGVRHRPEVRCWTFGSWALLLGLAALATRGPLPVSLSVVLGNGLIALGLVFYARALHLMLLGKPAGRGSWLAVAGAVVLQMLLLPCTLAERTVVNSWLFIGLMLPSLLLLVRHGWNAERSLRTVLLTMAMAAAALAVRSVDAWLRPDDYLDLVQQSLGQGLTFLVCFMALLGAGFGFVLAVFERVAHQMEVMASHDGLTGCLNRSTTDTLLAHALARSQREGSPLAFVLLDLDHFKQVNDLHGHRCGDDVLKRFSKAARQRLRAADALGRTGGEEFGLILPATDAPGAQRLVDDIRRATESLGVVDSQGQPVQVTVSAGIAVVAKDDPVNADRLYGRADQALYEAKRQGRNRVELYADAMRRQSSLLPGDA